MSLSMLCGIALLPSVATVTNTVVVTKTTVTTVIREESQPAPEAAPLQPPVPVTEPEKKAPEKEKQEQEPPQADAAEPRRLVRYFCKMWKDEEYEQMYFAMAKKYRDETTLEKFKSLFEDDAERTGGLKDENIVVDDVDEGKLYTVTVDLRFNFVKARDRRVKAVLEKTKSGYRIRQSGIVPLDLSDL